VFSYMGMNNLGPAQAELCHATKSQAGRFLFESYSANSGGPR